MSDAHKQRLAWLDAARGIAILLVIVGHTTQYASWSSGLRGFIFSFYMPLFFILSAMTFRFSSDWSGWRTGIAKSFRRLIIPALWIWGICSVWRVLSCNLDSAAIAKLPLTLLMAQAWHHVFLGHEIPALGMAWFVIVLFVARSLFDGAHHLSSRFLWLIAVVMMTFGVFLGRFSIYPLAADTALVAVGFLFCGTLISKIPNRHNLILCVGSLAVWFVLYVVVAKGAHAYLEMGISSYPLFPLSIVCALLGSFAVIAFSRALPDGCLPLKVLSYIGQHSLTLYFIHSLEDDIVFNQYGVLSTTGCWILPLRLIADLLVMFAYLAIVSKFKQRKASHG